MRVLDRFPQYHSFTELSFVDSLVRLKSAVDPLHGHDALLPAAISLLCLKFPLQVTMSRADTYALLTRGAGVPYQFVHGQRDLHSLPATCTDSYTGSRGARRLVRHLIVDKNLRDTLFPPKKNIAAQVKPNVVLAPLVRSFSACAGPGLAGLFLRRLAGRVTQDVAMAAIIYAWGLVPLYGIKAYDIAAYLCLHPDAAKGLSTALKALGANSTDYGAVLCEAQTLLGRAVSQIDLKQETAYRCDPHLVAEQVINPGEDLRVHIRAILSRELLGRGAALPPLDHWWSARWLWCVNGSQNTASSEALKIDTSVFREFHTREYRRMASEAIDCEPITTWDGHTNISASAKLEHGKTRAIYACDTRSYFAFEWLLGVVQKSWRNDRVLLDPGAGGHLGIAKRVRGFMKHGGVNLMLDYDDFNSHHSLRTMDMLFDELCEMVGAPAWYREILCNSFYDMHVKNDGKKQRWLGTLPSGHRGTTIINSVLNAAYIRMAVGGPTFDKMVTLHTGDDVYMRIDTLSECERILESVRELGCRINPAKQSVGYGSAEFLRMAITQHGSFGYLPRSIASFVSGNWINQDPLDPADALRTAIVSCRALINRSGQSEYARLLGPALRLHHPLPTRKLIGLLAGSLSLDDGPVFNTSGLIEGYHLEGDVAATLPISDHWPHKATDAYLTHHVSEVELHAIDSVGANVANTLIASSYSKGHSELGAARNRAIVVRRAAPRKAYGFANANDLLLRTHERGELRRFPIINLLRSRLTTPDVVRLLQLIGVPVKSDPWKQAFGESRTAKNIVGNLSYSDAATLSKRTKSGNIFTLTSVRV